jgi:hypothetical protein
MPCGAAVCSKQEANRSSLSSSLKGAQAKAWVYYEGMAEQDHHAIVTAPAPRNAAKTRAAPANAVPGTKRTRGTKFAVKSGQTTTKSTVKISTSTSAKRADGAKKAHPKPNARTSTRDRALKATGSSSWQPQLRASQVVRVLGNRRAAALLGVSESQPSRWRNAVETPSSQVAPLLVDLDHIIARLQLIWDDEVIGDWLEGVNAFLDGARPIDVLRVNGSVPVLEAIEAEAEGAYA